MSRKQSTIKHGAVLHDTTVASATGLTTHAALTTGVHGAGASTLETITGAQAKADAVQTNLSTHTGAAAPHSGHAKLTTGSFSGDSTVNRAIAHGLSRVPKYIWIENNSTNAQCRIPSSSKIKSGAINYAVTAWDATNFYVGNATEYNNSANYSGYTYDWMAIG